VLLPSLPYISRSAGADSSVPECQLVVAFVDAVPDGSGEPTGTSFVWNVRTGAKFPVPSLASGRIREWYSFRLVDPPVTNDGSTAAFPGKLRSLDGTEVFYPLSVLGLASEARPLLPIQWRDDQRLIAVSDSGGRMYEIDYSAPRARRISEESLSARPFGLVRDGASEWYLVGADSSKGRELSLVNLDSGELLGIGEPVTGAGPDARSDTYVLAGTLTYVTSSKSGTKLFHFDFKSRSWRMTSSSPLHVSVDLSDDFTVNRESYNYLAGTVVFRGLKDSSRVLIYSVADPTFRSQRIASFRKNSYRVLFRGGLLIYRQSGATYEPLRPSAGRPRVFPKTDPQGRKIREVYGFGRFVNYPEGCGWM
jgi:hypothetical protein